MTVSYWHMMLEVWSVFRIGKGFLRSLVGIQCFCMKAQSIQLIWAPESMIVVVSSSFIVRGETMSFILMYKEFFCWGVLRIVTGSSGVEAVLPFKNPGYTFLLGWRAVL